MKTDRGTATRERILTAAVEMFAAGGFQNLRIASVCEAVDVSATSIYWHFGSKAGLVQAVLERAFSPLGAAMLEDVNAAQGTDQINAFIAHLRKLIHERPAGSCSMLAFLQDPVQQTDGIRSALTATREAELVSQVELMKASLKISSKAAQHLALLINACVNYGVMIKLCGGSDKEVETILQTIRQAVTDATGPITSRK